MGRQPCCEKIGLKRGPWTIEEDHKLMSFILNNGIHCWRMVPKLAGLMRCGKSCRLRWINYLRPDLKRGELSEREENQIIQLHSRLGNRWSKIAAHFPGRTDNEIKNHWNTRIKKRLKVLGLDPVTHNPIEHHEFRDAEGEQVSQSNSSIEQEKNLEVELDNPGSMDSQVALKEQGGQYDFGSNGTNVLLDSYDKWWESLDMGLMMNSETNPPITCSSSLSLEDSLNPSMGESSSLQEESLQQWVDTVDSILSWDGLHHLDGILSLENHL